MRGANSQGQLSLRVGGSGDMPSLEQCEGQEHRHFEDTFVKLKNGLEERQEKSMFAHCSCPGSLLG